jgi:membrane-anchored mycosin MYCP
MARNNTGFTIVYKIAAASGRGALASPALRADSSSGAHSDLLKSGHAKRIFPDAGAGARGVIGGRNEGLSLQNYFFVRGGAMKCAAETLERLSADRRVELGYVAPPRSVLGSRRGFAASGTSSQQLWRDQIKWSQARSLSQWKVNSPVEVGVLDTGFDRAHPQLTQPAYQQHLNPPGNHPDAMGHGTHVCGQLVATRDVTNGFEGLVGDCARVSMHCGLSEPYDPVPYYQGLLAACTARLINLSVGGEQEDQLESNIIKHALARDAVVVAAIGNHAELDSPPIYPAAMDSVIAVGAVDSQGLRAGFSNEGDHILISAPGVDILSTVPTYHLPNVVVTDSPPLGPMSGTSMAAPIVTAVVARMLAYKPGLTRAQVIDSINGSGNGWNRETGRGVIDAYATLSAV